MLCTKLNAALSAGSVNRTRSNLIFGKWLELHNINNRFNSRSSKSIGMNSCFSLNHSYVGFPNAKNFSRVSENSKISLCQLSRNLATIDIQEKADIFGDLGDKRFDDYELDEAETNEEEFIKHEAKRGRRFTPSAGRYADMIKKHITSGDLSAALDVLDQVKEDRNKPNNYMYNLLIRAFAVQGDVRKCFHLYNAMKKRELKPTLATYTSLLNACANSDNKNVSLEKLKYMRQMFIEQEIALNPVHYNTMIKAYGYHGELFEAFQLVDEMRDKKLTIGISTLNHLLQGTISNKEAGFRHALLVWQLLRSRKLKPDIYTFNLLLRSARDCKLGNFRIEDLLIAQLPGETKTLYTSSDRTNLLAHPPQICPHLPLLVDSNVAGFSNVTNKLPDSVTEPTQLVTDDKSASKLEEAAPNTNTAIPVMNLQSVNPETNLLIMGGFNNFVDQMKADNIKADIKTVTYLMELVPPSLAAEKAVIQYAKSMGIKLDVSFYNLLIRKRSFRFDYQNALKVLTLMQQDMLEPDIMTWGVLALTCRSQQEARKLFEGMETSGHRLNVHITGALLSQATHRWLFGLILELMEKMLEYGPKPNERIFNILEEFKKTATNMSKNKRSPDFVRKPFWINGYRKFNQRYPVWLKEINEDMANRKLKRF